ncbi:restriction endonuclease [Ramlibacter pallidus]|uniref:restriction endonuclease n=1 Tax=Ramlibacter pallidus TaxID=2780087 RepID=UPI001D0D0161|nr:restriction endonuclease [Ramlibacter pallidus]
MLDKGLLAVFIGGVLLCAPLLFGTSPMLRPMADGLRTPAWVAILLGLALLALHWLVSRTSTASLSPESEGRSDRPTGVLPGSKDMFPPEIPAAPGTARELLPSGSDDPRPSRQQGWSAQVFRDIEWRRFEAVCERLFAQAGFEAKTQSHGADGGVDIWLYSKNATGPVSVVQCKHWSGRQVGVKEVREFLGVMTAKGVKRGTYATTSTYTPAAAEFARENGIHVMDGVGLLGLIARRSKEQQEQLLAVAYEGDYWRPTCASCGVKLVDRVSGKDGSHFWGCVNYPRCRSTMPVRYRTA